MTPTSQAGPIENHTESLVVELFRHNLWANLRLIEACEKLEPERLKASAPGTFGQVYDTLIHIVAAEEWYILLLTGRRVAERMRPDNPPSLAELRARAQRTGERLLELARTMDPAQRARWQQEGE